MPRWDCAFPLRLFCQETRNTGWSARSSSAVLHFTPRIKALIGFTNNSSNRPVPIVLATI